MGRDWQDIFCKKKKKLFTELNEKVAIYVVCMWGKNKSLPLPLVTAVHTSQMCASKTPGSKDRWILRTPKTTE